MYAVFRFTRPHDSSRVESVLLMKAGEDAAAFDSSKQSTAKWTFFTVELAVVLAILYAVSLQIILLFFMHQGNAAELTLRIVRSDSLQMK